MSANVETMFSVRETPWHGIGKVISEEVTSADALRLAGLDWSVIQTPVFTENGIQIPGYYANVRETDKKVLGIVSNRYKIVQNVEAFEFTDNLLGEGVKYETAGSLASGKRVWLLAKMETAKITGEDFTPYLVFTNTHDGTGAIKVALVNTRVVCQNTLNLALNNAKRTWTCIHKGDIQSKLHEAEMTLFNAKVYQDAYALEIEDLKLARISDDDVTEMIAEIIPIKEDDKSEIRVRRLQEQRAELRYRYEEAPDLQGVEKSMYRFVNAVSDFATHRVPDRNTKNYNENLFMNVVDGEKLIDLSYAIAKKRMTVAA